MRKKLSMIRRYTHWCISFKPYHVSAPGSVSPGFPVGKIMSSSVVIHRGTLTASMFLCVTFCWGPSSKAYRWSHLSTAWLYRCCERRLTRLLSSRFHVDGLLSDGFVVVTKCLPWEQWPLFLLTCLFVMGLRSRVHFYKYIMGGG